MKNQPTFLKDFKVYLEASKKAPKTTTTYISHLRCMFNIESILDEEVFEKAVGLINYNTYYSEKYNHIHEPTKRSYRSALNSYFDFLHKEDDYDFICVETGSDGNLLERDYYDLLDRLETQAKKHNDDQIKVEYEIKQVKKGCLIWTVGIVIKGVKNGLKIAHLVSKIIKDAKDGKLNPQNIVEYSEVVVNVAIDLMNAFSSKPGLPSVVIDSMEIGSELIGIIEDIKNQSKQ